MQSKTQNPAKPPELALISEFYLEYEGLRGYKNTRHRVTAYGHAKHQKITTTDH